MNLAVNEFGYDRWGGSPASAMRMLLIVRWLYRNYFRVETSGLEHLPSGRVMVVGNHSAQLAYDGMLVAAAVALDAEPPRMLRAMIEYFFANVPLVSILMTRVGQLTGTPENAERLLAQNPMGRMGDPEKDIAPAALFLASDEARYVTGNTLHVDGGGHINGVSWAPELPE